MVHGYNGKLIQTQKDEIVSSVTSWIELKVINLNELSKLYYMND